MLILHGVLLPTNIVRLAQAELERRRGTRPFTSVQSGALGAYR
jgi:hypothetical protein